MKILTIGTATVDYIIPVSVPAKRNTLTFEKGKKYEIPAPIMRAGGGALNAAVTCARAGRSVILASQWGSDAAGSFLENNIRAEGIIPQVTISHKQPTGIAFELVSSDGERTVLVSHGALSSFSFASIPTKDLSDVAWAYVVTGSLPIMVIEKSLRLLRKAGISIALSPSAQLLTRGKEALAPILNMSDVVIMNRAEATLLTGIKAVHTNKLFIELDQMIRGIAVMTDGDRGALVSDGSRMFASAAFRAHVVDETGAGDAFGSGFIMGLLESNARYGKGMCTEDEMMYALRRGLANAASVVEHLGATEGILTKKQFLTQKRWRECAIKITHLN
ncbi:MAG: carbohydrate kinase family protein [Candidatus Paceibacterota bacterium]